MCWALPRARHSSEHLTQVTFSRLQPSEPNAPGVPIIQWGNWSTRLGSGSYTEQSWSWAVCLWTLSFQLHTVEVSCLPASVTSWQNVSLDCFLVPAVMPLSFGPNGFDSYLMIVLCHSRGQYHFPVLFWFMGHQKLNMVALCDVGNPKSIKDEKLGRTCLSVSWGK